MPLDYRQPIDMREVIARIVDRSEFTEFGADYGSATVVGHAALYGQPIGIITNNGPIDPAGANKATHFIHSCCQAGIALLYLQNTTGYIVGKASEQAGMIKHGSKMIQAVSNATVPSITLMCGASFGAGNYGMCGRAYGPRFVFSWPNTRTAVMGGEQAALTMRIVAEGGAKRKGVPVDEAELQALEKKIIHNFDSQSDAFYTSGILLDDGVIDPRDTRQVLGLAFDICRQAEAPPTPAHAVRRRPSLNENHHATPALHRRPHCAAGLAEEVLRSRDQPAHRRMGKGRDLPGQGAVPQDGQARLPGREQAGRIRRPGPGLQLCRGLCRGPVAPSSAAACRWPSACRPTWPRRRWRASAPTRCARNSSRRRSAATTWPAWACRKSAPAPTWPRSRPMRARTATTTSSTAARCGPPTAPRPTGAACWPTPARAARRTATRR